MKALRSLEIRLGIAAVWPAYMALIAYALRASPLPRVLSRPGSFVISYLAVSLFIGAIARFILGPGGWLEECGNLPVEVTRQLRRALWVLVIAGVVLLLPDLLLLQGLIAPKDRPIHTPVISRLLGLAFEIAVWLVVQRLVRSKSPLVIWFLGGPRGTSWVGRHRRLLSWTVLVYLGGIVALDGEGYSFSSHRVSIATGQAVALVACCFGLYKLIVSTIDRHAWRWVKHEVDNGDPAHLACRQDNMACRLRRLAAWVVPILGIAFGAWMWRFDPELLQYVADIHLWGRDPDLVRIGDLTKAIVILSVTAAIWRYLTDFFTVAIFPRMTEDPGIRYAVLTLCRYLVLAVGALSGLSAVHLGLDKIGMVLAALGVGLGFGLQEIVSNFVSGIILLIERPIRVGDVVTVSGMSGRVDRINIRATTIINGDNHCMIVPNREFITSNLVNWTHKDRIIRVSLNLHVGYGNDPDRISDLLLSIASTDEDVLHNPAPAAAMEAFGESTLRFVLHVFVADPSLAGRVKHRLFSKIQSRFHEAGIEIPLPVHEFHMRSFQFEPGWNPPAPGHGPRLDPASATPPTPRYRQVIPAPAQESHRGVDE